jgi:hypothetical protein
MTVVKRKVLRTTVVLLILLLPWALWRLALRSDVHAKLAAIHKSGLPTNARELDKWYEAVPADENAGLLIHNAIVPHDKSATYVALEQLKLPITTGALSSDQNERLEALLSRHAKDLASVDEALSHPRSRYPVDLTMALATPLPDLARLKTLALLYQAASALALQHGEFETASGYTVQCILLARTLDAEPLLISQLVRLSLLEISHNMVQRRINTAPLSAGEIERLSTAIENIPRASNQLSRALIGERAVLATYFDLDKETASRILKSPGDDPIAANTFPNNPSLALKVGGFYDLDRGYFLHSMAIAIEKAEMGPPESLHASAYLAKAGDEAADRCYFISGNTLAAYGSSFARFADAEANWRLALVALKIEQFRNAEGHLPRGLDELPPQAVLQMASTPSVDPYTGGLFHFKMLDHGHRIYSVGRDGEDNDGVAAPIEKRGRKGYDIVFAVTR